MSESDIQRIYQKLEDIFELIAGIDKREALNEQAQVTHRAQCSLRHEHDGELQRFITQRLAVLLLGGLATIFVGVFGALEIFKRLN